MYFACKIVSPKMSDSLERTRRTDYLSLLLLIYLYLLREVVTQTWVDTVLCSWISSGLLLVIFFRRLMLSLQ